ncbi:MAG: hypothetical protein ABIG09_04195, partial [bacterium]
IFALISGQRSEKYIINQKKEVIRINLRKLVHLYLKRSIKIIPRTIAILMALSISLLIFFLIVVNDLLFGLIRGKICFKTLRSDKF